MSQVLDILIREQRQLEKTMERLVQKEECLNSELNEIFKQKIQITDSLLDIQVAIEKLKPNTESAKYIELPTRLEGSD